LFSSRSAKLSLFLFCRGLLFCDRLFLRRSFFLGCHFFVFYFKNSFDLFDRLKFARKIFVKKIFAAFITFIFSRKKTLSSVDN